MKAFLVVLALLLPAEHAAAQSGRRDDERGRGPQMTSEERQRMREDMREAYRERGRRTERPRELTPQERDKLRQDIQDANRDLRRR